jgi:phage repressor protein C with HTH and peptisase S24 domain
VLEQTSIQERIRNLIQYLGLNPHSFAEKIGVSKSSVYNIIGGPAYKPSFDLIAGILRAFEFINPEWLLLGKGEITKKGTETDLASILGQSEVQDFLSGKKLRILPVAVNEEGDERISMVPVKAAAGYLMKYLDPQFIGNLTTFDLPGLSEGTYRAFEIEGDSMLGRMHPGDWVISRYVDDWTYIKNMQMYVVVGSEGVGIVLKRVVNKLKSNGTLVLHSDNSFYPPYEITINDISEVWEVKRHLNSNLSPL